MARARIPHWFGESARGSGGLGAVTDRGGQQLRDYSVGTVLIRVTGPPADGTADYPWVQVDESDPDLGDLVNCVYPLAGTATSVPAREVNKNRWLGPWVKARATFTPAGDAVLFEATPTYRGKTTLAVAPGTLGPKAVTVTPGGNVLMAPMPSPLLVDVFNPWKATMPANTTCQIVWASDQGRYEFVALDCPS